MTTLILASQNPVKLRATVQGFRRMFPDQLLETETLSVPSGVADQPHSDEETLQGARNRAGAARLERPDADYWVGIEGGLVDRDSEMEVFAWIVVLGRAQESRTRSASFFLPPAVARLVRQGLELGDATDHFFRRRGSKTRGGAVGLLTDGLVDRTALYEQPVVLAFIPFRLPELYDSPSVPGPESTGRARSESSNPD